MKRQQPSRTAELVAAGIVALAKDRELRRFVDPRAVNVSVACLRRSSTLSWCVLQALRLPPLRSVIEALAERVVPGLLRHFVIRKHFIAQLCREELEKGGDSLCVVGAGYDPLVFCLQSDFETQHYVELDHPATQSVKEPALRILGAGDHVSFVKGDLTQSSLQELLGPIFSLHSFQYPVFILEGILMYLAEDEVVRLFNSLGALCRGRGAVLLTWMLPDDQGRVRFHNSSGFAERFLSAAAEEFKWGVSEAEFQKFFAALGMRVERIVRTWEQKEELGVGSDTIVAKGEAIALLRWVGR